MENKKKTNQRNQKEYELGGREGSQIRERKRRVQEQQTQEGLPPYRERHRNGRYHYERSN